MASTWSLFAFYLLPPPVIVITLLLVPLPRPFQKGLLLFCKKIFSVPFLGTFRVEQFFIILSGVTFGGLSTEYFKKYGKHADAELSPNQKAGYYSSKWRMERNWWIACFSFFAWCVMARFHQILLHKIKLQEKVDALEKSNSELKRAAQYAVKDEAAPSAPPLDGGIELASMKKDK